MIALTTDREEFAAARKPVLDRAEERIERVVRAALEQWAGTAGLEPVLDVAEAVLRDTFTAEYGSPDAPGLSEVASEFRRALQESLDRTERPRPTELDATVDRITRFVATGAVNAGTIAAAQASQTDDPDLELAQEWVTMRDSDVREAHRDTDGQVVPLGEPFTVAGVEMPYPGWPGAPIELWIHCRCVVRPTPREAASITAAADGPSTGVGVFALPTADDPVTEISSEDYPHVTLLWFGTTDEFDSGSLEDIRAAVAGVASAFAPIQDPVNGTAVLGTDSADVLLLDAGNLGLLRDALLSVESISAAVTAVEQHPTWIPHLTRGYPDTPGGEETPETIRFDRLALWVGEEREEFPLEGRMDEARTAAAATEDDDVDTSDLEDVPTLEEDAEIDDSEVLTPWYGVLAPEGVRSGDRRRFSADALRWRDLPLPLSWQRVSAEGHDGSTVVARIDNIFREDGLIKAEGVFMPGGEADEVIDGVIGGFYRGVSVDADDATMAVSDEDGNLVEEDFEGEVVTEITDARISGATVVPIPAFQEAFIAIGRWADNEANLAAAAGTPLAREVGTSGVPVTYTFDPPTQGQIITVPSTSSTWTVSATSDSLTFATPAKTKDGPGWVTNPRETQKLRTYWARGPGAAKIKWGAPRDFYRCRTQLAKYVRRPDWLNGLCANIHYDALGYWPGQAPHAGQTAEFATGPAAPALRLTDCLDCLTASGEPMPPRPRSWFADPTLSGPTPVTVTEDGRVFGHLATWGTCHIGFDGVCVEPPRSRTGYAHFRTGAVLTDEGQVATGTITLGLGHAPTKASAKIAAAHYDDTTYGVADVAAGEDAHGVWIAGAVRPGVPEDKVYALRAAALSGDWRSIGGSLELVAALAVNVPGFPIPRLELAASGGQQTSLVAAGVVAPKDVVHTEPVDLDNLATEVERRIVASRLKRERLANMKAARKREKWALLAAGRN